ncbi:MAG: 2-C-methyl-D-erythritol 4-phosphate cytidylyltransferase [Alicyclobacillus sp.]|nr:2-C-methyl-D-erythritol 4-phosphate cytidylyltransferase [Alicyclobacillus sp.]
MIWGVLLAGGSGSRFGAKKQFLQLVGAPVWQRALQALIDGGVGGVILVVPKGDEADVRAQAHAVSPHVVKVVTGGDSRSHSVQCGLAALVDRTPDPADLVTIHDAARPFVHPNDVRRVVAAASEAGGAILGQACADTVKRIEGTYIAGTVPRDQLALAQTPQVFRWSWLERHYLHAPSAQLAAATDDASLLEAAGLAVAWVAAAYPNPKITVPGDWDYARWLAAQRWGDVREDRVWV